MTWNRRLNLALIWGWVKTLLPTNPKIAGKWMFIPLKIESIGIDPYPFQKFKREWPRKHSDTSPIDYICVLVQPFYNFYTLLSLKNGQN
jgi:hypothetical protein